MKQPHNEYSFLQAHPWHGISPGANAPELINAFIEIVPFDTVKYEIDKTSGHLKLDRPHKYSSLCPTLYGFIPQTYCAENVAALANTFHHQTCLSGDYDPLDICVLTENNITRGGILVAARPIGGFRVLDQDEVDDKIIAVLLDDFVFGALTDLSEVPIGLLERLKHYFLTYKEIPESPAYSRSSVVISEIYHAPEALQVIEKSIADYNTYFR